MFGSTMTTTPTLMSFLGLALVPIATEGALTSGEKQNLLSSYNVARGKVNPTATNMLRMEWDDAIAAFAICREVHLRSQQPYRKKPSHE